MLLARNSQRLARPLVGSRLAPALAQQTRNISVGDKFPSVEVDKASWPPTAFNIADRIAGKKVIICGLPGAFTPT